MSARAAAGANASSVLLAALCASCGARPIAPPLREAAPAALGAPERVALADLDGDGRLEAVGADGRRLVACHLDGSGARETPALGAPQVLCAGSVGEGARAVVVGWGMDRANREARASIVAYFWEGGALRPEAVLEPVTSRQEIAALRLCDWPGLGPGLLYAAFESKYFVDVGFAARRGGAWTLRPFGRFRMVSAVDLARTAAGPRLVVGRLYGDSIEADGDAFLFGDDGSRTPLPTTRGVRSLVAGGSDVFLGDGWHREYVAKARGLVTHVALSPGAPRAERVEDTAGQFMISKLALADLDGDGTDEILGLGPRTLRVWRRGHGRFAGRTVAENVPDFAAAPGLVLTAGAHPEVLRFRGVRASGL